MEFLSKLNYQRKLVPSSSPQDHQDESENNDQQANSVSSALDKMRSTNELPGPSSSTNYGGASGNLLPGAQVCSNGPEEVRVIIGGNTGLGSRASIMRFMHNDVNPEKWIKCKMVRDNSNRGRGGSIKTISTKGHPGELLQSECNATPVAGANSEYGAQTREEAKQRKRMRLNERKAIKPEDQPWLLKASSFSETKRFKGVKEGGVSDNASYYIFSANQVQNRTVYEAFPVANWFSFKQYQRHQNYTAEEAEETFKKRNDIYNYFSLISRKRLGVVGENDLVEKKKGKWIAQADEQRDSSSSDNEYIPNSGGDVKGRTNNIRFGALCDDDDDSEREVGYMSSSQTESSSSEIDEEAEAKERERERENSDGLSISSDSDEEQK